jgi:hypothetical protein
MILLASIQAQAGQAIGNGGGAWVCRNQDATNSLRWAELVDLFEARTEYYLNVAKPEAAPLGQLEAADARILRANPEFHHALQPYLAFVLQAWPASGESELALIDDALYKRVPARETCPSGLIEYGQVVNFTNDNRILIDRVLEQFLPPTDRAALRLHEAVYALLRAVEGVKTSERAREIVGHVFSDQDPSLYSQLLQLSPQSGSQPDLAPLETLHLGSFIEALREIRVDRGADVLVFQGGAVIGAIYGPGLGQFVNMSQPHCLMRVRPAPVLRSIRKGERVVFRDGRAQVENVNGQSRTVVHMSADAAFQDPTIELLDDDFVCRQGLSATAKPVSIRLAQAAMKNLFVIKPK